MKTILFAIMLLLSACDRTPVPKLAEPQRETLEKARGVELLLQKAREEQQKDIGAAGDN